MLIDSHTVAAFKEVLTNPLKHGLLFRPLKECFEVCEEVTPKHILAKQFIEYVGRGLNKLILYIILDEIYGPCVDKAANGDLGYKLRYVEPKR